VKDVLRNNGIFTLIAGPCVIESYENAANLAREVKAIADPLGIDYYFKASVDKANRTSAEHYRGPGFEKGLDILAGIKDEVDVRVVTDIHEPWQAAVAARVADIIQIPAFLCRQTDLLAAAAETCKVINVKKAQFMSPEEMGRVVGKLKYFGNDNILLCERGTCFGYNNQVVDMAGIVRLRQHGYPVVFDATHSVQISGGGAGYSNSGASAYVPYLARAAIATGQVDALFLETHDEPQKALCDGSCMVRLDSLPGLLRQLVKIYDLCKE
jgi:2-dehydro-3-deoxyphosphooctonate aldolase (KDO 8-P synthase)